MSSLVGFHYFAEKAPDFVALVDPERREWSRAELSGMVNRLSRALCDSGLRPGDVIAIVSPNCAEYVAVYLAGIFAGLQVVPVNWHLAESEIAFIVKDSGARAVIAHQQLGTKMLKAIERSRAQAELLLIIGEAEGFSSLKEFAAPFSPDRVNPASVGRMMAYTSATTGRPKAVVLPSRNAAAALERIVEANRALGILPEDGNVHLCASMLYHSAPLGGVDVALQMGHRVVLVGHWDAEMLLKLIDAYRVTTTFLVPTMFVRLLKLPTSVKRQYSTKSLRFVTHGAAPCPPDVKRQMIEWWGNVIWESYGATETQGTIVSTADWLKYPGTVGRPLPGAAVKILDEEGRELPAGHVGLIYLRPHTGDRFEYKDDPDKTRRSYQGDFISVGDLGYLNEEGYLFVCDRSANLIISSGMNIYPAEIEALLSQHPAVADCAVVGESHALLGAVPKAFVQLESGVEAGPDRKAELLSFLGRHLSVGKMPKRIEFVERIPRDPNGKLFKRLLDERRRGASEQAVRPA